MSKQYKYKGNAISYFEKGTGETIILLHGYLETKEVWNSFADKLSKNYRVVGVDIPGHGKSDIIAETHTLELMAESVKGLLEYLKIDKYTIIGHSMGGYVMLAFADLYPEKLSGIVLFHSSVYADNDEKKTNRLKDIEAINEGELKLIINSNIPKTFANDNLIPFYGFIETMKIRALKHNPNGVCAILRGMMERYDRQELIARLKMPILFIFGIKDNFIPIDIGKGMGKLNNKMQLELLPNSGHMGFVEEEEKSINIVATFLKND